MTEGELGVWDERSLERPGPLTLDPEAFRRAGHAAIDLAADYLASMRERPVFQAMPPEHRASLMYAELPDEATDVDALLTEFSEQVMPYPLGNGHPRFYGWVNSSPAPAAILADLLAATMNPSCAGGDHAAIYLERAVARWLMELVEFPTKESMGLLVSGGSMASLTCLAAARHQVALQQGWNVRQEGMQRVMPPLVLYLADEGHNCLRKAAELLGIGAANTRLIPVTAEGRIEVEALDAAIIADREAGLQPFCVAGSAGTATSGIIDPLNRLADLCRRHNLWFHVDGAYGALGMLDPRARPAFNGIERADSLALDPHKWLSVPVECGCALVRDGSLLRDAFSLIPSYLRTEEGKGIGGLPWYSEYGFQQTRGFRALKLWMTLRFAGRDGLVRHITRQNDLARLLARLVDDDPRFERVVPVDLSIVCFRAIPDGVDPGDPALNSLNQRIADEVQAGGEAFITSGVVNGRTILHANTLNGETTAGDVRALLPAITRVIDRITQGASTH